MIAGTKEFIEKVRRYRKMYGGGMRQIGFLAAAGIYALDHHVNRLADDHRRAKRLAIALQKIPGIKIDPERVQTNIIYFEIRKKGWDAKKAVEELKKREVLVLHIEGPLLRAVTHLDVNDDDIERAILIFGELFG